MAGVDRKPARVEVLSLQWRLLWAGTGGGPGRPIASLAFGPGEPHAPVTLQGRLGAVVTPDPPWSGDKRSGWGAQHQGTSQETTAVLPHRGHDDLWVYAGAADSSSTKKKTDSSARTRLPRGDPLTRKHPPGVVWGKSPEVEDVKDAEAGCDRGGDAQRRRLGRKVQEGLGTDCRGGRGAGDGEGVAWGPLLGICPRPPGSLPAGLTLESEPSHLRPETAAAHPVHIPRTVYGAPAPHPCVPRSAQPWRRPRGLGTASGVPGVGRGSPDRVLEVPESASKAASWVPGRSDPGRSLTCSACGRSVSRGHILLAQVALDTRRGTLPGQGAAQHRWWSRPSPEATGQLCAPPRTPHLVLSWLPTCCASRSAHPPGGASHPHAALASGRETQHAHGRPAPRGGRAE